MSSFLCFLCHSAISSDTNEEIRDKYREVVGLNLCPDSHLCHVCRHLLQKYCLFRTLCLKRSLEYPVLFIEKGALNLQKSDLEPTIICTDESCKNNNHKNVYNYDFNSKVYEFNYENVFSERQSNDDSNQYVELEDEKNNEFDDSRSNDSTQNYHNNSIEFNENRNELLAETHVDEEAAIISDENIPISDYLNEATDEFECNKPDEIKDNASSPSQEPLEQDKCSSKPKKKKKVKRKSFKKIVLSYKEQKAALDQLKKEKKYLEAEYKCYNCAIGFLFKDSYQSHMMRHEESNGQFSCRACSLRFATPNAACMHAALHAELHRCNACGARVRRPHRARHARDCWRGAAAAVSCAVCSRVFRDKNCLQQHTRRFHEAKTRLKTYSCAVCGRACTDQGALRTHMLKHINKSFPCADCGAQLSSPYGRRQHLRRGRCPGKPKPPPPPPGPAGRRRPQRELCHLCAKSFYDKSKLKRHLREVCERTKLEDHLASYYEQET